MTARELELELPNLRLAARAWGAADGRPVLALHGWLDNAASFDRLAPLLPGVQLVALDLPGHGRSSHRPAGASAHFVDWVVDVVAAADALGWSRFALLGHSMGAGIASLIPAAFPERVERLILVEGFGPLSASPAEAPDLLAQAVADERQVTATPPRAHASLETAITARMVGSDLDREAARILVERAVESTHDGVRFIHDPRLKTSSRVRLTEEQVEAFLSAIRCPVLAIKATDGWPFPADRLAARLALVPAVKLEEVPGGHHVHLTHSDRIAPLILPFLLEEGAGSDVFE